ncbi:hypothetical protein OH76DRAFT_1384037 [Lentinus brumalis]|uniref:DUF6532 domain-containing protein n=1 Tax=Lentinus brumalis TaxID=2498619 RepID=A0A371D6N8_9APHY|nr:hypothetical protein OH76DRAFT_1384037 [Polyporus brumalis]
MSMKTPARAAVKSATPHKSTCRSRAYPSKFSLSGVRSSNIRGTYFLQVIGDNHDEHAGLYEAEIIQVVVNRVWYKDAKDDGILLGDTYTPFPMRGLALVLTAIQCAIEEWSFGQYSPVAFTEQTYKSAYKAHCDGLQTYEQDSKELKIVSEICASIAQEGRLNAKAPRVQQAPQMMLPETAISNAIATYVARRNQKSGLGAASGAA